jgi:predicted Zn-dependent peptidase
MFLGNLTENEKKAFLFLADKVLKADNIVAETELSMLRAFAQEMGLSESNSNLSEDETYTILTVSENKTKRAVYAELLSLAFVDSAFAEKEIECLKNIQEKLGLPEIFTKKVRDWLVSYIEKTKEGFMLIEGGL